MTSAGGIDDRPGDGQATEWGESAPVALVALGADGRATACNGRWREYAGLAPGDPVADWPDRLHPDDAPPWREALRLGAPFQVECRLRGGDGGHRWFLVRASPRRDADGAAASWVAACADIDELAREREALRRSNHDLERFAAVAAHDLQEPLRKIRAFGERLTERRAASLDERGRDYLRRMLAAAGRMSDLIRGVLDYSRLEGQARGDARVDLSAVADEVLADLSVTIEWHGGTVEVGSLPMVVADPTQMRQLLQNLIANALKFARTGEPPRVRARGWTEPGRCVFEVADEGVGFAAEDAARIFEPFRRLRGRGGAEGCGLGLAICRRIVERHGGTIVAESSPGAGAVFRVTLPDDPTEK